MIVSEADLRIEIIWYPTPALLQEENSSPNAFVHARMES
jgi:hypothetical protein